MTTAIVWFRQDLRLTDNPALHQALQQCEQILCVFIDDTREQTVSRLGSASRVWLHHSLEALDNRLKSYGNTLYLMRGDPLQQLQFLVDQTGAQRVYWNRCYDPVSKERDTDIKQKLSGVKVISLRGLVVFEPWENLKADESPYRVYTPFWRAGISRLDEQPERLQPLPAPSAIPAISDEARERISSKTSTLSDLQLLPDRLWHKTMMQHWQVGETSAEQSLTDFVERSVAAYDPDRDKPAIQGTSRLSPHLHFGEISARTVLNRLRQERKISDLQGGHLVFAKEIFWREFAYSLLHYFPKTIHHPLDQRFERFPWAENTAEHLQRWQKGQTGVPIVDAGMRELYTTGWMHNRVRMIVASYLIKNLLIPWQLGEAWFRDTLVDADLASNVMGWQWTAGSGADAAPFFRVFNPVLQGEKFDTDGVYVKRWVPELADIPAKKIHKPWELAVAERNALDYPEPLVDLKLTRQRALDAFAAIKSTV